MGPGWGGGRGRGLPVALARRGFLPWLSVLDSKSPTDAPSSFEFPQVETRACTSGPVSESPRLVYAVLARALYRGCAVVLYAQCPVEGGSTHHVGHWVLVHSRG